MVDLLVYTSHRMGDMYYNNNTPIHIKPITIVNNPLKGYSAPLSSLAADSFFPVKHCYICDESPITPIVSYNPTLPYRIFKYYISMNKNPPYLHLNLLLWSRITHECRLIRGCCSTLLLGKRLVSLLVPWIETP